MRERLIELIQDSVFGCARHWAEVIADGLLANGVIVPPCKAGQTVYAIDSLNHKEIYECRVNEISMSAGNNNFVVLDRFIGGFLLRRNYSVCFNDFGKTVFLTREEAEKALKEAKG